MVQLCSTSSSSVEILSHPRFWLRSGLKERRRWSAACRNPRGHSVDLFLHHLQLKYSDQICVILRKQYLTVLSQSMQLTPTPTLHWPRLLTGTTLPGKTQGTRSGPRFQGQLPALGDSLCPSCDRVSETHWLQRGQNELNLLLWSAEFPRKIPDSPAKTQLQSHLPWDVTSPCFHPLEVTRCRALPRLGTSRPGAEKAARPPPG